MIFSLQRRLAHASLLRHAHSLYAAPAQGSASGALAASYRHKARPTRGIHDVISPATVGRRFSLTTYSWAAAAARL